MIHSFVTAVEIKLEEKKLTWLDRRHRPVNSHLTHLFTSEHSHWGICQWSTEQILANVLSLCLTPTRLLPVWYRKLVQYTICKSPNACYSERVLKQLPNLSEIRLQSEGAWENCFNFTQLYYMWIVTIEQLVTSLKFLDLMLAGLHKYIHKPMPLRWMKKWRPCFTCLMKKLFVNLTRSAKMESLPEKMIG